MTKYAARIALALIVLATLLGSFSTPTLAADNPIDLELGGEGATSWNITDIKPGDSGTKTVSLHHAGSRTGVVTIWISDVVSAAGDNPESETGDTAEPGELDDYLLFNVSCSRLQTSISLPTTIDNLPQSTSDELRVTPLNVGDTVTLDWQWELPIETNNDAQGDRLSFTINYMLEEFPPPGGGGGGGGPAVYYIDTDLFGIEEGYRISRSGELRETIEATSGDSMLTMSIPKGTVALDKDDKRLKSLQLAVNESPPPPPEDACIIGLAYTFQPEGATFDPPITLTWRYDTEALPEDVAEEDLVIAYYDEDAGKWVELDCVVDTENDTITASIAHFTTFAIIGIVTPLPPAPAVFIVSDLTISPSEVNIDEGVSIDVIVANTGGQSGSCRVTLKINDVVEATQDLTVNAGFSQKVTFTTAKDVAGTYSVDIDGLTGSFAVKEKPAPPVIPKPIPWPLIGGIIAGGVVVGLLVFFLVVRRRAA